MAEAPPPGFYEDSSGVERWWDGSGWTEHRKGSQTAPPPAKRGKEPMTWTATVGYLLAIFMPFIGFFVGLALVARGDRHGGGVVLTSVGVFLLLVLLLAS